MSGLPCRGRGRPTTDAQERYDAEVQAFCATMRKIDSGLDFRVSSRGWCYVLENRGLITKGEFDQAQKLINDCRKSGDLPLDICAADEKRETDIPIVWRRDGQTVDEMADSIIDEAQDILDSAEERSRNEIENGYRYYTPFGFWDHQEFYIELVVEKIDLKSLFKPIAHRYNIPITNIGGWCDINGRAAMMRRFAEHERAGRQCVLLYCGDHDPGGLQISDFIRWNFVDLTRAVGWNPENLIIDRFGLNADFIEHLGLTWIDNLVTGSNRSLADPRHPDHHKGYVQEYLRKFGARKVEANALVVRLRESRQLCLEAILKYLPEDALDRYQGRLNEAREQVRLAVIRRMQ
jgi:hypothetical protein